MVRATWLLILILCWTWGTAAQEQVANVEPPAANGDGYERLISRGIAEFNLAHWAEARAFFVRAHAMRPTARTLRTLGLIAYEQRNYIEAIAHLEQALAHPEKPLTAQMRAEVTNTIEEASTFVTRLAVVVEPSAAKLSVDGQPVMLSDDGVLVLDPGDYEIRFELSGYIPYTRLLHANGGDQPELRVHMLRAASEESSTQPPPITSSGPALVDEAEPSFLESLSTGQHVGLALGVAGVIALGLGTTFSVIAVNQNEDSQRTCDAEQCDDQGRAQRESAQTNADLATGSFIAAGALLATSAVLLFATGSEEEPDNGSIGFGVAPHGASAIYTGRF